MISNQISMPLIIIVILFLIGGGYCYLKIKKRILATEELDDKHFSMEVGCLFSLLSIIGIGFGFVLFDKTETWHWGIIILLVSAALGGGGILEIIFSDNSNKET